VLQIPGACHSRSGLALLFGVLLVERKAVSPLRSATAVQKTHVVRSDFFSGYRITLWDYPTGWNRVGGDAVGAVNNR
jgi:hypothetical protein